MLFLQLEQNLSSVKVFKGKVKRCPSNSNTIWVRKESTNIIQGNSTLTTKLLTEVLGIQSLLKDFQSLRASGFPKVLPSSNSSRRWTISLHGVKFPCIYLLVIPTHWFKYLGVGWGELMFFMVLYMSVFTSVFSADLLNNSVRQRFYDSCLISEDIEAETYSVLCRVVKWQRQGFNSVSLNPPFMSFSLLCLVETLKKKSLLPQENKPWR